MTKVEPDGEYVMLDMGGDRLTHYPSGDTCLRQPWMIGRSSQAWMDKLRSFVEGHPDCTTVVNHHLTIIGSIPDMPVAGAVFRIGDVVVRLARYEGAPLATARVIGVEPEDESVLDADDAPAFYILDDGRRMYWNGRFNGWMAAGPDPRYERLRRPLMDEDTDHLAPSPDVLASDWLPVFAARLSEICVGSNFFQVVQDADEISRLQDMACEVVGAVGSSFGRDTMIVPQAVHVLGLVIRIARTTMEKPGASTTFETGLSHESMAWVLRTALVLQTTIDRTTPDLPEPAVLMTDGISASPGST